MVKIRIPGVLNIDYLLEHADDIINNTSVLLDHRITHMIPSELSTLAEAIRRKHSANWMAFGRSQTFINPGETEAEAYARINLEYCEATGHWDLFIWEDVPEESLKK